MIVFYMKPDMVYYTFETKCFIGSHQNFLIFYEYCNRSQITDVFIGCKQPIFIPNMLLPDAEYVACYLTLKSEQPLRVFVRNQRHFILGELQ